MTLERSRQLMFELSDQENLVKNIEDLPLDVQAPFAVERTPLAMRPSFPLAPGGISAQSSEAPRPSDISVLHCLRAPRARDSRQPSE